MQNRGFGPFLFFTAPKHSNVYAQMPLFRAVAYQKFTFSHNGYPSMPLTSSFDFDMFLLDLAISVATAVYLPA